MPRRLWLRIGLVAVVAAVSIFYLYPPRKTINLGLDLQGGIHLVLGVDIDKALQIQTDRTAERVRSSLEGKGLAVQKVERRGNSEILVQLASPQAWSEAQSLLQKEFPSFEIKEPDQSAVRLVLSMRPSEINSQRDSFVRQGLETIRNRVDQFGVAEPSIQQQGDNRILVQLPGIQDPDRAKALIGKTALLEFKLVDDRVDPAAIAGGSSPPPGDELLYERRVDPETKQERRIPIVVQRKAMLSGADVADAEVRLDQGNQPYVSLTLTPAGGKVFAQVTTDNVGRLMAMVLFHATLTLPGIAGVVLTIGMAVDTNILIFERIREELRSGKTVRAAIDSGFSRAFRTVIDTHVTVLVSAAILYQFGTGPVKGFAVTLAIGIFASLFTAVFFTRLVFDLIYMRGRKVESISI